MPETNSEQRVWKEEWQVAGTAITFDHHSILGGRFFAGYKDEIEVGRAMALRAIEEKQIISALLFGMAGTGKTAFPYEIASRLKSEHNIPCSLLTIRCEAISGKSRDVQVAKADLAKTLYYVKEYRPLIVVFDELDALAPDRVALHSIYRELDHWLMDRLSQGFEKEVEEEGKVLVFGVTNDPSSIDSAVLSRLGNPIYFDLPDRDTIIEIFEHFGIPSPQDVWNALSAMLEDDRLDGRGLIRACKEITKMLPMNDKADYARIAEGIYATASRIVTKAEREGYERKNERLIKHSIYVKKFWKGYNI